MEIGKLILWAAVALGSLAPASGSAYSFPYADPYYASFTVAILKADHLDKSLRYEDISVSLRPERDQVPYFGETRNKLSARYWNAGIEGPLVVMIAGLGGNAGATYQNFLASHFVKRGIHVLALPSPFHFSFALAASQSGVPGITRADAADLHEVIEQALKKAKKRSGFSFPRLGLMGVSMGALEAAYLAELDSKRKIFNFKRTLLVNPPVDPLASGASIDALFREGSALTEAARKSLRERVVLFGSKALMMMNIKAPGYFDGIEQRLPTTLAERKFLIGSSMTDFLQALIFATQQVQDLGILRSPPATDKPDARLAESAEFSYREYLDLILLPTLSGAAGRKLTFAELKGDVLMQGVEAHLRSDRRVFLMHNQDDFIVNRAELDYLRSIFGDRFTLYPHGGHVGNIWYPENLEKILNTFAAL
jgi:pimeloyl-ACP methyl ester carboxylesterase